MTRDAETRGTKPAPAVLVTGASSGIGSAIAGRFHARGARLVLVARRGDRLAGTAAAMNRVRPGSAETVVGDLTDGGFLSDLASSLDDRGIDVLVSNAGRGSFGRFDELALDDELAIIRLNVAAPVVLSRAVIPRLRREGRGGIIVVSSLAGFGPLPYMATYGASKAFLLEHTLALREELRGTGVVVTAACPGPVDTEFGGVARVPGTLTGVRRDPAGLVAEQIVRAYEKGKAVCVPGGFLPRVMRAGLALPRAVVARAAGRVLREALAKSRPDGTA